MGDNILQPRETTCNKSPCLEHTNNATSEDDVVGATNEVTE